MSTNSTMDIGESGGLPSKSQPHEQVVTVAGETLGASAFEALRDAILTGRLFSGQRLVETALAAELGISRGPLREALALLERDGLVEAVPRRGRFVLVFTRTATREFYELRKRLEVYAVETIIEGLTAEKIAGLVKASAAVSEAEDSASDLRQITIADIEFHGRLYQLSDQHLLHRIWTDSMASKLQLLVNVTVPADQQLASPASNHDGIVRAIRRRDVAGATRLVWEHIDGAEQRALQAIAERDARFGEDD